MTKGAMHIVEKDEKKKRPENTSLRDSSVNWIRFREHSIEMNNLFA